MCYGFKHKYYDPVGDKKDDFEVIQTNHVVRFYRVMMARMWSKNTSVNIIWSICEVLDAVPSVKESIPKDAYKDLYCCMHIGDDWEADLDSKQDEYFSDPKVEGVNTTATQ